MKVKDSTQAAKLRHATSGLRVPAKEHHSRAARDILGKATASQPQMPLLRSAVPGVTANADLEAKWCWGYSVSASSSKNVSWLQLLLGTRSNKPCNMWLCVIAN